MESNIIEGPYFEDFKKGEYIEKAPSVTLTDGYATTHQMFFGDRLRLPLDHVLCEKVTGTKRALANPSMVINVAIGQTTYTTQNVMGNLFYRGLVLKRPVYIGDTLSTSTKVVMLKENRPKKDRLASGLVVLEITTTNQDNEEILHFWRCPMVPRRYGSTATGNSDDVDSIPSDISLDVLQRAVPTNWDSMAYKVEIAGNHFDELKTDKSFMVKARDTVTCAPELARITLNLAALHTDAQASLYGKRLVYGGYTISMAAAQMLRALPNIMTILAWRHCDHIAPVFEDDILQSEIEVKNKTALATGGGIVDIQIKVYAERKDASTNQVSRSQVLDWVVVILMA